MSNDPEKSSTEMVCPKCASLRIGESYEQAGCFFCAECGSSWNQRDGEACATFAQQVRDDMAKPSSTEAAPVVACPACGSTNMELTRPPDPHLLRCLTCTHSWCELERKTIDKFGYAVGMSLVEVAREQRAERDKRDGAERLPETGTTMICPKCQALGNVTSQDNDVRIYQCVGCSYEWATMTVEECRKQQLAAQLEDPFVGMQEVTETDAEGTPVSVMRPAPECPRCRTKEKVVQHNHMKGVFLCTGCVFAWCPKDETSVTLAGVDPGLSADQPVMFHQFPVRMDDGGAFPIGDGALQDAMRRLEEANAQIERLREKIEKQEEDSVLDYNELAELARRICVAEFQPMAQAWEPLNDIRGVTSQLSNMAAGLSARITLLESDVRSRVEFIGSKDAQLRAAGFGCLEELLARFAETKHEVQVEATTTEKVAAQMTSEFHRMHIAPSEGEDSARSIHSNPDARAWAKDFVKTVREIGRRDAESPNYTEEHIGRLVQDEEYMLGWFANAMMAMHDHMKSQEAKGE